jgi:PAS domain S-box-containing protein
LRLTSRLILLAAIALLPAIAVQIYNAVELRRDREDEVRQLALDQAYLASSEIDRIIDGVHSLLIAVSAAESIQAFDTTRCVPYLRALSARVPYLASISAAGSDGVVRCRQDLPGATIDISGRDDFQQVRSGVDFVVGVYSVERVSGKPILPVAVSLRDRSDKTIGAVVAALDLNWLTRNIRERGFAPGDSLTVADRNGVIIVREPQPERFVGTAIPDDFMHLVTAPMPGVLELTTQDGTRRVLGYVPAADRPTGLYVSAGLSASEAFAAVREATLRSALLLFAGLAAALVTAAVAGRYFIKRPVDRLLRAAAAWQAGNLSARTGLAGGYGEFGQIGGEMDRAADEVQRRQAALKESEERYRALSQATAAIEWRADPDGSMHEAPMWAAYTGQPYPDHAGRGWLDMVHPEDRERVAVAWDEGHGTGNPVEVEYRVLHAPSGKFRWVRESGVPLWNADGSVREWVGAVSDIHERRQAEQALKESGEQLRVALAAGRMGTWHSDLLTGELYWDAAMCEIFGIEPKAGIPPGTGWALIHPDDRDRLRLLYEQAMATGEAYDCEFRIVRPSGELRWLAAATGVTRDPAGRTIRISGVTFDITDRKVAEERQHLLVNELNHRVKNTLASVQAIMSQSLRHTPDPWDAFERAQTRLMALSATHDLLNTTRWSGASLSDVLRAELKPYRAEGDGRITRSGPPVELDAKTALALGMIVHELATNAAKYGALSIPEGRIEVTWSVAGGETNPWLDLTWLERDGPQVYPPTRRGFGTRMIERGVAGDLLGKVKLDYDPSGFRCAISFPLRAPFAAAQAS